MRWLRTGPALRPTDGERAVVGAIVLVLLAALVLVTLRMPDDGGEVFTLEIDLPNAGQGLSTASDVRIRGVRVGEVHDIALDPGGRAVVTVGLDQPAPALPTTTAVSVLPLSLFGPQYLDLDPGAAEATGPFLASGARLSGPAGPTELQTILADTADLLAAIDGETIAQLVASGATIARDLAPRTERLLANAATVTGLAADHTDDGTRLLADLVRAGDHLRGRVDQVAAIGADISDLVPLLLERRDQISALLVSTSRTATVVGDLLVRHPDAVAQLAGSLLPALLPPLAALVADITALPDFADAIAVLFGELASVFHLTGPADQRLGAIELQLGLDPCELLDLFDCHQAAAR